MAQQVLTGSQKGTQKSRKGGNALHFLSRLELAILWRLSGIYWIEPSRFLGLQRLCKKETPKAYGLGEYFWCESIVAEGEGRKRVHGKRLTTSANNCFCSQGYKAVVAKPWSWKGLLLLSKGCVWPGFVYCLYFLASWPEMTGKGPWGCPWGGCGVCVYSASSSLLRNASPRNPHELLCREQRQSIAGRLGLLFIYFKIKSLVPCLKQVTHSNLLPLSPWIWRCIT